MAPELWRGAPADERSDLFACGVLLSECLRDDSPAAVRDLAERLRAEHRELRPASAAEALRLLEAPAAPRADEAPTLIAPRPAPRGRRLAPVALCLAAIGTGVVVASTLGGGGGEPSRGTAHTTTTTRAKRSPAPASAAAKPPPVAPAADGAALNDRGYQVIQQGRYAEAVPVLQQAVSALQASGGLDYAFALFNLGNALRLAGRPAEAIPILEQRLQIANQTGAVQAELEQARRDLAAQGQGTGKVKKAKKPKGGPRARGD
jgi:tetratricopeptide (TPR) repeat protein